MLGVGANKDTRASPADRDLLLDEKHIVAWLGTQYTSVGRPAVKTGPSKPEILGAILWASLANAGNVWHVWQVVGAGLAGPVPKRESMMARAAPEMGTAQEKQAPRSASECNIGFSQRATVDPGRRHDTSPRSRHEADAFRQLMLGGRDWS